MNDCTYALQVGDLSLADATEEEKLMAMMSQAGEGFDPSQYVPSSLPLPPPPSFEASPGCNVSPST